jgi:4-aminobutyrate--pyruvate transaminase
VKRENLPDNAQKVGAHFLAGLKRLERHPMVGDVRGVGLIARIELVRDKASKQQLTPVGLTGAKVQQRAQELGVIFRNVGDVLTFSPPLILTEAQADDIVDIIDQAIGDVTNQS